MYFGKVKVGPSVRDIIKSLASYIHSYFDAGVEGGFSGRYLPWTKGGDSYENISLLLSVDIGWGDLNPVLSLSIL